MNRGVFGVRVNVRMCHDLTIELRLDHFSYDGRACTVGSLNSFLGKASVSILTLTVSLVYV